MEKELTPALDVGLGAFGVSHDSITLFVVFTLTVVGLLSSTDVLGVP